MKRTLIGLGLVAAVGLGLAGCKSKGEGPATQTSTPPGTEVAMPVPLVAQLVVRPGKPVTAANGAVAVKMRLTLVVTNTTSRAYQGEAPTAALAKFAITDGDEPLWSDPISVAQVVTPVTIAPGQQMTFHAETTLPDVRPYRGKLLTARAQFTPAALTTRQEVPVN